MYVVYTEENRIFNIIVLLANYSAFKMMESRARGVKLRFRSCPDSSAPLLLVCQSRIAGPVCNLPRPLRQSRPSTNNTELMMFS